MKKAIVYYSMSGNTDYVAKYISDKINKLATLVKNYTIKYDATNEQSIKDAEEQTEAFIADINQQITDIKLEEFKKENSELEDDRETGTSTMITNYYDIDNNYHTYEYDKNGTLINSKVQTPEEMENMYGSTIDCGVDKSGDNHILKFYIESIKDEFSKRVISRFTDEIELSFSGTNPLTHQFVKTEKVMKHNFECYQQFFTSLVKSKCPIDESDSYYLFRNVDINYITKFLDIYKTEQKSINNSTLSEYIKLQYENHNILEWNVGFMSNSRKKNTIKYPGDVTEEVDASYITMTIDGKDYMIYQNVRNNPDRRKEMYYCMVKNQLDSTKDRFIDINKKFNPKTDSIKDNKELRSKLKKGLILLYTLDERAVDDADFGVPFVGYSIHFPLIENEEKVKYKTSIYSDFDDDVQDELNDMSYE